MSTTPPGPPPAGGDPNYPPQAPPPTQPVGSYPAQPAQPAGGYPPPQQQAYGGGGGGGPDVGEFARRHLRTPETKEFFKSSEFAVWLVTAIAVMIAGLSADDIEPSLVWTLVTVLSFAYIISRGIAKAGTKHHDPRDR